MAKGGKVSLAHIFITILIALDVGASLSYLILNGDWRRGCYWAFAAGLTYVVTF